jgi:tRNA G10  N-methylase Trm11
MIKAILKQVNEVKLFKQELRQIFDLPLEECLRRYLSLGLIPYTSFKRLNPLVDDAQKCYDYINNQSLLGLLVFSYSCSEKPAIKTWKDLEKNFQTKKVRIRSLALDKSVMITDENMRYFFDITTKAHRTRTVFQTVKRLKNVQLKKNEFVLVPTDFFSDFNKYQLIQLGAYKCFNPAFSKSARFFQFLASQELQYAVKKKNNIHVLDVGTGSGIIALSASIIGCVALGTDIDASAIKQAQKNATHLKLNNVSFIKSDLFNNIPKKKFDYIIFNPPCIADADKSEGKLPLYLDKALYDRGLFLFEEFIKNSGKYLLRKGKILTMVSSESYKTSQRKYGGINFVHYLANKYGYTTIKKIDTLTRPRIDTIEIFTAYSIQK